MHTPRTLNLEPRRGSKRLEGEGDVESVEIRPEPRSNPSYHFIKSPTLPSP